MRRALLVLGLLLVVGWPAAGRGPGRLPMDRASGQRQGHRDQGCQRVDSRGTRLRRPDRGRRHEAARATATPRASRSKCCSTTGASRSAPSTRRPPPSGRPSSRRSSSDDGPNVCRPGEEGRMNTRGNDVKVDFTVRVPRRVLFVGRTVNGHIDARSLDERAEALHGQRPHLDRHARSGGGRDRQRGHRCDDGSGRLDRHAGLPHGQRQHHRDPAGRHQHQPACRHGQRTRVVGLPDDHHVEPGPPTGGRHDRQRWTRTSPLHGQRGNTPEENIGQGIGDRDGDRELGTDRSRSPEPEARGVLLSAHLIRHQESWP